MQIEKRDCRFSFAGWAPGWFRCPIFGVICSQQNLSEKFSKRKCLIVRFKWSSIHYFPSTELLKDFNLWYQNEDVKHWYFYLSITYHRDILYRHLFMALTKNLFNYRPQTKFAKVMFSQVSVCPQGEACMACMLPPPPLRHALLGTHTNQVCMPPGHAHPPGMHACPPGMHIPLGMHAPRRIVWDALNERAVRILLECILVLNQFCL